MKVNRVWLLVLAAFLIACSDPALICDDALGCVTVRPNEALRIGTLLADSGTAAFLGEDSRGGVAIAIDDRENGVLDHQVELVSEDTSCDTIKGQAAARALTADTAIIGVIGTNCSNVTETVMPIIDDAGLVMLSPSNTAPNLTINRSWRGAYARTAHNNLRQADIAAVFAYETLGSKTAVILHDNTAYANNLAVAFAASWRSLGGAILFEKEIATGQTDLNDLLASLSLNTPDVLYIPLFEPEAGITANTLHSIPELEDIVLIGAENLLVGSFPQSAGAAAAGIYVTGTAVTGDDYDIFLAKWDVKYGGSPPASYHAHAYDAANILMDAIEAAAQKSADGTLLIGRQSLRQAIAATTNFSGLTGTLTCDDMGDCASGTALGIYQITEAEIAGEIWPPPLIWLPH